MHALVVAPAVLFSVAVAAQDPTLTIDRDRPGIAVSPHLYGIFFEEINHAGEGGLWAQLLRNPTFEEPGTDKEPLPGWSVDAPADQAWLLRDSATPFAPATPTYARVMIVKGETWLQNKGHFGVPLRAGEEYVFTAHLRGAGSIEPPVVEVVGPEGVAWTAQIDRQPEGGFVACTTRARATATVAAGTLRLRVRGSGSLDVDTATLCPAATWKGHGLRQDLAEKLLAMHPAFLRFPGGCYVEGGDRLADAFRWQQTLGPLHDRPGHSNANWGYWSTDGLGYHEYLQLCEDLGALPMFVVNCGMSHREVVPMADLQPWIQSALDAIEYANGGKDTRWGKVRSEHGHPAPFGLRYLEIGNENGMFDDFGGTRAQYAERYERFRSAIAAAWPDVQTIANVRVDHPMQIVDDHFYMASGWFWAEADRYAKADRRGPKVYVGEYAVTHDPGRTGNLRAGLAEAAFLFGLERSSDHVVMASYAPLFVHVRDRKWNPDAIQFDGLTSCGTPSYHVQTMLAAHRPDALVACEVPRFAGEPSRGSIGLGTWNTQAEYRDVEVEVGGEVVYRSDFSRGSDGWHVEAGKWRVQDAAFGQTEGGDMRWARLELPALAATTDCVVRCKAKKLGGAEGFLLMFHVGGARDWTWFNVGGWGNRQHAIERCRAGSKFGVGPHRAGAVETGRWHDLRVECQGTRIRTFVDGAPVHDEEDRNPPDFAAVAGIERDGALVLKVCNGSDAERRVTVQLRGGDEPAATASGAVLTAGSLDDENTLAAPDAVAPRPIQLEVPGRSFAHAFPARSLTVLRLLSRR